jgi:F-type H+-transporting ATPase subunit b
MELIIQQVGALLLGAIPTVLLFIVLVVAYQFLVHEPLTRTLKERRARTEGAVEDAQKAIAEAEAKAADYAERLRLARVEVFKLREQRVKQWSDERDSALEVARKAAHHQVTEALAQIEAEAATARLSVQASAPELAAQVVRAILPLAAGGSR